MTLLNTGLSPNSYSEKAKAGKPSLLLLTQVLPYPPDAGPKIKTYNLIRYLASSFDIVLVSFIRSDNTPSHVDELLKYCCEVYTVPMQRTRLRDVAALLLSLLSGQPFLMVRDRSRPMNKLLQGLVATNKFVAIHADQLNMAQFALSLPVSKRVLDEHNAVWAIADRLRRGQKNPLKRLLLKLEAHKLRRYEQKTCRRFDVVLAVSREDALSLGVPCQVIPIGIDAEGVEPLKISSASCNLVSLGTMFYPPNIEAALWFGREVFPLIRRKCSKATYTIIGARPPAEIYQMAAQQPGIRVVGYVEDLRPELERCSGLIVPLLSGGGMRVKILDALALGLPIVSTTVGAEGVQLEHDKNALLADTPAAFAAACLRLLDGDLAQRLSEAGRKLALEEYDFRVAYKPLDELYSELIGKQDKVL
ncbi:glycosyltransferase family 4 protein [Candidatus Chlorohelix sp.]|uniref:glycosyltransferase family 4 protein n=1 Tax=Candidatus Chlorohelix sp. TaxID=3139201 RepID=UPI0030718B87